jgi:hypothetical protein
VETVHDVISWLRATQGPLEYQHWNFSLGSDDLELMFVSDLQVTEFALTWGDLLLTPDLPQ